jgi:hypothetical protein
VAKSDSIKELVTALSKAQAAIEPPKRSQTAEVTMKSGGKFKYSYTELSEVMDAIRNPFRENGLALIQIPVPDETFCIIETMLAHSSGEWISGTMKIKPEDSSAQKWGSCMTYIRRYSALALCGLSPEDDDGAEASGVTATKQKKEPEASAPPPHTDSGTQQQADAKAHWCSVHNTEYFKKGNMEGYGHPIAGTQDPETKKWKWCKEPTAKAPVEPTKKPEKKAPEPKAEVYPTNWKEFGMWVVDRHLTMAQVFELLQVESAAGLEKKGTYQQICDRIKTWIALGSPKQEEIEDLFPVEASK